MLEIKRIVFEITKKCNLSCRYCYVNNNPNSEELSFNEIKKFLNYLKNKKISKLTFTGGEPFLRKDFFKILKYASEKEFGITIFTNGTLINNEIVKELKKFNIEQIQVSLDGSKAAIHNKIREKGNYKKTINAIKLLLKNKFKVAIMTTITKENIDNIVNISRLCYKLGIKNWHLHPVIASGKGKNLDKIDLKKYLNVMKSLGGAVKSPGSATACGIGFTGIAVLSNGNITPCEVLHELVLGNIKKDDLLEVFYKSKTMEDIRNSTIENISECRNCPVKYKCRGGCKASVLYDKGTFFAPDLTNCISHKLKLDR